jgi:ribosomally synthesized peptide (two-chain TOMM family)
MIENQVSSSSDAQQFGVVWPQCVARAWQDEQFREALKRDPAGTLREAYQFTIPAGVDLQVVEGNAAQVASQGSSLRMVIPPMPEVEMREIAVVSPNRRSETAQFEFSATLC